MTISNTRIIEILSELTASSQLDVEQVDKAIDTLESIKSTINIEDDEAIDKVDEIQDYLQYLVIANQPLQQEVKAELTQIIHNLQKS